MRSDDDEQRLLLAAGRGDDEAFAVLYRRYLPLVLRWSLRQTGNREVAADLTAEVFAASLIAARRYRPQDATVGSWFLGIAANKLRESRRRHRVENAARRRLGLIAAELTDGDLERIDDLVSLDGEAVARAQQLPSDQRDAVMWHVVEERPYSEIAAELKCSESVVRQRESWAADVEIHVGGAMNSDFFDQLEADLRDSLQRGAHMPRWQRTWLKHSRALVSFLAVFAIATPAVAAITGVFGQGAPNPFPHHQLTPVRVSRYPAKGGCFAPRDRSGWRAPVGLRMIRTSRGDTCLQLGRVQHGLLGSLGIDHYWADDGQFHPILPNDRLADECGSTDATGYGFVSVAASGASASAGMSAPVPGPASDFCEPVGGGGTVSTAPACPAGSERFIFYGLLGPETTSVSYRTATGAIATQATSGGVGAYLIVEPWNLRTCERFSPRVLAGSTCPPGIRFGDDDVESSNAILSIHYRGGQTCDPSQTTPCPFVGYTQTKQPPVTAGQVSSPITVTQIPAAHYCLQLENRDYVPCSGRRTPGETPPIPSGTYLGMHPSLLVDISFIARRAIRTDNSSYAFTIKYPNCGGESTSAQADGGSTSNIHAGQHIHWQAFVAHSCHGLYTGTITYTPDEGPEGGSGGGSTNPSTITVGTFTFTVK